MFLYKSDFKIMQAKKKNDRIQQFVSQSEKELRLQL